MLQKGNRGFCYDMKHSHSRLETALGGAIGSRDATNLEILYKSFQKGDKMFRFTDIAGNCLIQEVIR